MAKPTVGQTGWGGVLNDHLTGMETDIAARQVAADLEADVAARVGTSGALDTALSATYATVDEIPPTPQRYWEAGDTDWTAAFGRMFADGRRSAYVPEASGVPYDISAGLTLPNDMSLTLAPGATVRATAAIAGAMLTIGDGLAQRQFGSVTGGTWDCNDLAQDGLFAPWQWGLLIGDLVIQDHARHGLILGGSGYAQSAQHKVRAVETYSSPGRPAAAGSYGIWVATASDGSITDTTVQSAETGFRADAPVNRYYSCHVWYSGGGNNKVAFDDQGGHNEWVNCNADSPSEYGWVLRGAHSRIIGGLSTHGNPALDGVPVALHVPADLGAWEGTIVGHRVLGAVDGQWAADFDGLLPWHNCKIVGCSTIYAVTAKLNTDSFENLGVFRKLQLNSENAGPRLVGGGASPVGLITGTAGDIWFNNVPGAPAGSVIWRCDGGTAWTALA